MYLFGKSRYKIKQVAYNGEPLYNAKYLERLMCNQIKMYAFNIIL